MFDVGFSEMLVIGIVALVVIGPERLPKVARTIGHLMGRAQRYVNDVKRDIDREMQIEELRKLQAEMQDAARNIESSVTTQVGEVKSELDKAQDTMNELARQADLTRLDDPLAQPSASAATEAGLDSPASSETLLAEGGAGTEPVLSAASVAEAELPASQVTVPLTDSANLVTRVSPTVSVASGSPATSAMIASSATTAMSATPIVAVAPVAAGAAAVAPTATDLPAIQPASPAPTVADEGVGIDGGIGGASHTAVPAAVELAASESVTEEEVPYQPPDHIAPDYSEGAMPTNPQSATGPLKSAVLVHNDVPPVT